MAKTIEQELSDAYDRIDALSKSLAATSAQNRELENKLRECEKKTTSAGVAGSAATGTLSRDNFAKLSPAEQSEFCRSGGILVN